MDRFFNPSNKAVNMTVGNKVGVSKYPWATVPPGKSFAVGRNEIKFKTLRSLASVTGKKIRKKFRVIDHGEGSFEVYCVPLTDEEAVQKSSNVVEALKASSQPED